MAKNLTAAEEKLAGIIWRDAPIASPDLVAAARRELNWEKSTTYTILKKLCDKGVVKNENAAVSVLLTYDELTALQSRRYIEESFGGSLPRFITSFIGGGKLSPDQVTELKKLIDEYDAGGDNG